MQPAAQPILSQDEYNRQIRCDQKDKVFNCRAGESVKIA
jgi:hypothetical protein